MWRRSKGSCMRGDSELKQRNRFPQGRLEKAILTCMLIVPATSVKVPRSAWVALTLELTVGFITMLSPSSILTRHVWESVLYQVSQMTLVLMTEQHRVRVWTHTSSVSRVMMEVPAYLSPKLWSRSKKSLAPFSSHNRYTDQPTHSQIGKASHSTVNSAAVTPLIVEP